MLQGTPYSEWAAPIVTILKQEGRLHLCGEYKVTVLDVKQYPLPKPEDIFATLSRGRKLTTLDLFHAYNQLFHAYNQLPLDEESLKYIIINIPTRVSININIAACPTG